MAFGGHSDHQTSNDIWSCKLGENNWAILGDLNFPTNCINFGSVVTTDERFVIFFGGRFDKEIMREKQHRYCDAIYVLDLSRMEFYESGIKCPCVGGEFSAVLVRIGGNYSDVQNLLNGFINNYVYYSSNGIPMDVVDLISGFLTKEYVYLLQKGRVIPKLWKICVDDILNTCE